ncbi:hypothetical protein HLH33_16625 [Gluconacetobacter diazotrophicus]|uniref:Uncharacterized protein n=1 Tax=Gluconacetobacter diazotrophicus TaxID=33996 RepID=A0A7W4NP36_GLUDI|nr:hypothetical protein [Gluconacetobacter diazotrophicus]MBB2157905.1 hypothetical protein [Gluconacetobacter diazotrophicus]
MKIVPTLTLRDYAYERGLASIRTAIDSSVPSLEERLRANRAEIEQVRQHLPDDYDAGDDPDGSDAAAFARHTDLIMAIHSDQVALNELCKAFVLALYHYWEVAVSIWARKQSPSNKAIHSFGNLVTKAAELGYRSHADLATVSRVANLIKHDNQDKRSKLKKIAPERAASIIGHCIPTLPFLSDVRITPETLEWVFATVQGSGGSLAQPRTPFGPPRPDGTM